MKIQSIAKNTSYFTIALVLQKVISFTYFLILAQNLIPEDLGKYYFAVSFTTIFAIFIDIGLSNVLVREVAKKSQNEPESFRGAQATKESRSTANEADNSEIAALPSVARNDNRDSGSNAQRLLSTVLAIKLPLALLSLAAVFILINVMGYPAITRHLVYIASIAMVLDSFTLSFYAIARGLHNLSYESIGVILFQLIVLVFGISALKAGLGLEWIISAVAIASVVNFSFSASVVRWKYRIKLNPKFDKHFVKILLAITVPFALFAIFQRIYMYQDTVLLSMLAGDRYVGLYQVAFKIIFALQFLPMAFVASLYPAFASYWKEQNVDNALSQGSKTNINKHDATAGEARFVGDGKSNKEQLGVTFERALRYLLIISLPISAGIIVLADKIIALFKPEYMDAILPLQITIIALVFIFLNFPIGSLLNACDRQAKNTRNMGIALVSSIALNVILIPLFQTHFGNGAIGAGITVVFTNFLMLALGLYYVPQILDWSKRRRRVFAIVWRVLLSVAVMSTIVIWLKVFINVFAVIIIGAIVYGGIMFLIGGIRTADIQSVLGSLKRS